MKNIKYGSKKENEVEEKNIEDESLSTGIGSSVNEKENKEQSGSDGVELAVETIEVAALSSDVVGVAVDAVGTTVEVVGEVIGGIFDAF